MLISLSEVMSTKDKVAKISAPLEFERFDYQGASYGFAHKEPVELTITNLGGRTVFIEGGTNLSLTLFCSRCLKEIIYPMDIKVSKEVDFNLSEDERAEGLDETNYIIGTKPCSDNRDARRRNSAFYQKSGKRLLITDIIGYNLDVDILIYDEILIGFPMKLLCSEDCKGICRNCGANLNEKACGCDTSDVDPRMSVIRDIFNNFKEV